MGVNDASVFKGFCSRHDTLLFRSAEITNPNKKHGMFISLPLRALALEYCRRHSHCLVDRQSRETGRSLLAPMDRHSGQLRDCLSGETTQPAQVVNIALHVSRPIAPTETCNLGHCRRDQTRMERKGCSVDGSRDSKFPEFWGHSSHFPRSWQRVIDDDRYQLY